MTRIVEDARGTPAAAPDLVIFGPGDVFTRDRADFALAGPNDRANPMGLRAGQTLATAIMLTLMSDARDDAGDPADRSGDADRRGWPGDGFDVDAARGEGPLGCLIWTRYRYGANAENAQATARQVEAAFEPLIRQGVIGAASVTGAARPELGGIALDVKISAPDGRVLYDGPYAGLWEALGAVRDPLAP